jgi:hypothetical protein
LFASPAAAAKWMMENHGLHKELEIDRVDNNGPYAPGNMKWSTKHEQMMNNRRTVMPKDFVFRKEEWPYCEWTTMKKLRSGMSREEVMAEAWSAVKRKKKNWRVILKKLESLTS